MCVGGGWPHLDACVPWPCSGTPGLILGPVSWASPPPHTHHDPHGGTGIAPYTPPLLLIRGGQEIACVLGDKCRGCLAGGQRARALPDGSLPISPSTGGLCWARLGSDVGGQV